MRVLLDTHAILWFYNGSVELSAVVRDIILDPVNDIYVSIASLWEMTFLTRKKRIEWNLSFDQEAELMLSNASATLLLVQLHHVQALMGLPAIHKDPFDQMIAAQAGVEEMIVATRDDKLKMYPIHTVW